MTAHTSRPDTPESPPQERVKACVFDEFSAHSNAIEQSITPRLVQSLEEVHEGVPGETIRYGNSAGLNAIEILEEYKRMSAKLDTVIAEQRADKLRLETVEWKCDIFAQGFLAIRGRRLENYVRHVARQPSYQTVIDQGNNFAHRSNAVADAMVFLQGQRTDVGLYEQLYGLTYQEVIAAQRVLTFQDGGFFNVLDTRAEYVFAGLEVPANLAAAFNEFIVTCRKEPISPPSHNPQGKLGAAWLKFLNARNTLPLIS
ncbi:MAG: hypothetical protein Q9207_006066 [Kuettlingeria erythrocarpa]